MGGQAWLWEKGQLMGFSTKVTKGGEEASKVGENMSATVLTLRMMQKPTTKREMTKKSKEVS